MKNTILLSLLSMLCSLGLIAQPVADFSLNIDSPCSPVSLSFTDESTSDVGIVSWLWDFADGNVSSIQNPIHVYTNAGSYNICLTVTDINGLDDTHCETFIVPGILEVSEYTLIDLYCEGETASIDITVVGGTLPYTYTWSNAVITEDIDDLDTPGTYVVTVTDANNCTLEQSFIISEPSPIVIIATITDALCGGALGCVDFNGTSGGCGAYLYSMDGGITQTTDPIICNLLPGTYDVTITDCNGCLEMEQVTIGEPNPLNLELIATCAAAGQDNGTVTAVVSGGAAPYTFAWNQGAITQTISNLPSDLYSVTVVDANGCTVESSIETNEIIIELTDTESCGNGSITPLEIVAPTAVNYNWTPASLLDDPTSASPNATVTASTVFSVTVTNAEGCEDYGSLMVEVPNVVILEVQITNPSCGLNDGEIEIFSVCGDNIVTYAWDPAISTTSVATGLSVGLYEVTVTNDLGLTGTASVELTSADFSVEIVGGVTNDWTNVCLHDPMILCADVSDGDPGAIYTYDWSGPIGYSATEECMSIDSMFGGQEGTYSVIVTDDNGCEGVAEVDIDVITANEIVFGASLDQLICTGEAAQLEVVPVGDIDDYNYTWSPIVSLNDPNINNPTSSPDTSTWYTVTVEEIATGCSVTTDVIYVQVDTDCMWPGDADTNNIVNNYDLLNIGIAYDSIAPVRQNASLDWIAQPAPSFGPIAGTTVDRKHIDTDGNGIINADDTMAIILNWGLEHQFTGGNDPQFFMPEFPQSSTLLTVPFYVEPDTLIENESYSLPIILGEFGNEAENVYGLAFSLEYDSSVIVPGSASVGYGGWIGNVNNDMLAIQKTFNSPGRIDVGITRIDGLPMTGFGQIGELYITIEDDILFRHGHENSRDEEDDVEVVFNITNAIVINHLGEEIPIIPMETTTIVDEPNSASEVNWDEYIQVMPNPSDAAFFVTTNNIEVENIKLFSITGELLVQKIPNSTTTKMSTATLTPGTYLLKVQTALGVKVEKVLVVR